LLSKLILDRLRRRYRTAAIADTTARTATTPLSKPMISPELVDSDDDTGAGGAPGGGNGGGSIGGEGSDGGSNGGGDGDEAHVDLFCTQVPLRHKPHSAPLHGVPSGRAVESPHTPLTQAPAK